MKNGYLFCGDILGFSSIVESLNSSQVSEQIELYTSIINQLKEKYTSINVRLFSDTVLAFVENDKNDLGKLIEFSRELLNLCIVQSLPIRGAITFGNFTWGEMIFGKAVIDAHELEKNQNWIGIIVNDNLSNDDFRKLGLICYPAPMSKDKLIKLYPVISWDVPKFSILSSLLSSNGLGGTPGIGKSYKWDWGEKLSNTIMFGIYLDILKTNSGDPNKFYGHLPIEMLDLNIRRNRE